MFGLAVLVWTENRTICYPKFIVTNFIQPLLIKHLQCCSIQFRDSRFHSTNLSTYSSAFFRLPPNNLQIPKGLGDGGLRRVEAFNIYIIIALTEGKKKEEEDEEEMLPQTKSQTGGSGETVAGRGSEGRGVSSTQRRRSFSRSALSGGWWTAEGFAARFKITH